MVSPVRQFYQRFRIESSAGVATWLIVGLGERFSLSVRKVLASTPGRTHFAKSKSKWLILLRLHCFWCFSLVLYSFPLKNISDSVGQTEHKKEKINVNGSCVCVFKSMNAVYIFK